MLRIDYIILLNSYLGTGPTIINKWLEFPGASSFIRVSNKSKERDIKIAAFIACHAAIRSVDHLSALWNKELLDLKTNNVEELRLHRTKCTAIIINVLEPSILKELVSQVSQQPYSIILDESTDVSEQKVMAYCITYYNAQMKEMVSDFLGFERVTSTTAADLYDKFVRFISKNDLNLQNLIGLGTDGASNLCGRNNSL